MPHCQSSGLGPLLSLSIAWAWLLFLDIASLSPRCGAVTLFVEVSPPQGRVSARSDLPSDVLPLETVPAVWKPDAVGDTLRVPLTVWLSGLACVVLVGQATRSTRGPPPDVVAMSQYGDFPRGRVACSSHTSPAAAGDGHPHNLGRMILRPAWLSVAALACRHADRPSRSRGDKVKRLSPYDVLSRMSVPLLCTSPVYLLLSVVQPGLLVFVVHHDRSVEGLQAPFPVDNRRARATSRVSGPPVGFKPHFSLPQSSVGSPGGFSAGVGIVTAQCLGTPVLPPVERRSARRQIVRRTSAWPGTQPGQRCATDFRIRMAFPCGVPDQMCPPPRSADATTILPPAYIWASIVFFRLLWWLLVIWFPARCCGEGPAAQNRGGTAECRTITPPCTLIPKRRNNLTERVERSEARAFASLRPAACDTRTITGCAPWRRRPCWSCTTPT